MKYRHVIWDWKGTLLDDTKVCTESVNHILSKRHMPSISINDYWSRMEFPVINYSVKEGSTIT